MTHQELCGASFAPPFSGGDDQSRNFGVQGRREMFGMRIWATRPPAASTALTLKTRWLDRQALAHSDHRERPPFGPSLSFRVDSGASEAPTAERGCAGAPHTGYHD